VEGYAVWDYCTGDLPGGLNRPLRAHDVDPGAAERIRWMVEKHVGAQRASRFVNKNTRNARRITYLNSVFPDAFFVHVIRDPLAAVRSLTKVAFWPELPIWWADDRRVCDLVQAKESMFALAAEFWAREIDEICAGQAAIAPSQFIEVRYEALISEPAPTIATLIESLGLPPSGSVTSALARIRTDRNSVAAAEVSRADLDSLGRIAGKQAESYGYDLETSK
jgi:hypothetical protein